MHLFIKLMLTILSVNLLSGCVLQEWLASGYENWGVSYYKKMARSITGISVKPFVVQGN